MAKCILRIGDCFRIPSNDGRSAYGQYIYWDGRKPDGLGCMIRIFGRLVNEDLPIEDLDFRKLLFPPVFVGLNPPIRSGRWKKIGSLPVEKFIFPKFRSTNGHKPGVYSDWRIWNGKQEISLGKLPPEYRNLEKEICWGDELLEDRIFYGQNPFENFW